MARTRGQETIRDMVLSLAVVMAGVFVYFFLVAPRGSDEEAVKVVENANASVRAFAAQAPYSVLAPSGLEAELWKPTSLRVDVPGSTLNTGKNVATLRIGYVVDRKDRTFARFEVTNQPEAIQKVLGNRPATGQETIAGRVWDERVADGHVALTYSSGPSIVIIDDGGGSGGADKADLAALAASLSEVAVPASSS